MARHFDNERALQAAIEAVLAEAMPDVDVLSVDATTGVTVRSPEGEQREVPFDEIVRCRLVVDDPFAAAAAHKSSKKEQA